MNEDKAARAEIESAIGRYRWFQSFEIVPGMTSPGMFPVQPARFLDDLGVGTDLTRQTTLDVGCMEGAVAFELEQRGAASHAVDIHDPDEIAFNMVKRLRGSSVIYRRGSVYDVGAIFPGLRFDLIVFKGVYYHLRNPVGALEALAAVTAPAGRLIIAGECLISFAVDLQGKTWDPDLVRRLAESDLPVSVCYPGSIVGHPSSTWFVPNVACLKGWLQATGWELERYTLHEVPNAQPRPGQRFIGIARRAGPPAPVEHPIFNWRS